MWNLSVLTGTHLLLTSALVCWACAYTRRQRVRRRLEAALERDGYVSARDLSDRELKSATTLLLLH